MEKSPQIDRQNRVYFVITILIVLVHNRTSLVISIYWLLSFDESVVQKMGYVGRDRISPK